MAKDRFLARLRRDDGAISIEYAALVIVGIIIVGVLLGIAHSDAMRVHLTELIMKDPA
ncbi:DUF4244 domain-containing protein [Dactylosporangium sp. CA-139114]|uniref:DUF4244 domain-containing protein n=1 Tax=Dactylosporangium sp. CA-139114 TaxID=3239931 RepID=UPI003D98ED4B